MAKQERLQFLMVCVALLRHFIATGSKHDAAFLTYSQDGFRCFKKNYGVMSIICDKTLNISGDELFKYSY